MRPVVNENRILSLPHQLNKTYVNSIIPLSSSSTTTTTTTDVTTTTTTTTKSSALNSTASVIMLGQHKRSIQPRQPQLLTNTEFGGKYVILEPLEASSLYTCIDKETLKEYVCKVR